MNDLYLEINPVCKKIIGYPKKLEVNWNNIGGLCYLEDEKLFDLSWAGYPENGFVKFSKNKKFTINNLTFDDSILSSIKTKLKTYICEIRYLSECNGVLVNNQYYMDTDDRSKLHMLMKYNECILNENLNFNWKTKSGYMKFTSEDFIRLYNKIQTYIQKCFDLEFDLYNKIDNCDTIVKLLSLDLENISWVSNSIDIS